MAKSALALFVLILALLCPMGALAEPQAVGQESKKEQPCAARQVLVVLLYDDSCKHACSIVRPIMEQMTKEFENNIRYVELNSAAAHLQESIKVAKSLGIPCFLSDGTDQVPLVAVFEPGKRRPKKELQGAKKPEVYRQAIESVLNGAK